MITQESELVFSRGETSGCVSVVVPLYNYSDYIEETLGSVVGQDFDDLSIIVINDCSIDDSLAVARRWMEKASLGSKSAFLLNHRTNAGLSITRNTGTAFAKSEFCFFLDADNLLYPSCIRKHFQALSTNPDATAAYSMLEVFDGESGLMGSNVFDRERLKFGNYIDAMAMVRRDYLLSGEGYRPIKHGWEDYDLWLRMCEENRRVLHIPEILARYRVHRSSMLRSSG